MLFFIKLIGANGILILWRGRGWYENWLIAQQRGWWLYVGRILLKLRGLFSDVFRSKAVSRLLLLLRYFDGAGVQPTPWIYALVAIALVHIKFWRIFFFILGGLWWHSKFRVDVLFFFAWQLREAFLPAERWLSITKCSEVFRPPKIVSNLWFTRLEDMWRYLVLFDETILLEPIWWIFRLRVVDDLLFLIGRRYLGGIQDYILHHLEIMIPWQIVIRALKVLKQVLGGFGSVLKVDLPLHQKLPECCLRQVLDALIQHACPIREVRSKLPRVWFPI